MREPQAKAIHLKDYAPPAFLIGRVTLDVDIRADDALVKATLAVRRNPASREKDAALVLDGDELELVSVLLDGKEITHKVTAENLSIPDVPDAFTLETVTRIVPQKNTKLEGLYATQSGFVTQCEAQGFRRITWFLDRPDNLAVYTVTVRADRKKYPVLLSNGNRVASGENWATFEDPFPKPSYLFALVAADLEFIQEPFVSCSGKTKNLFIQLAALLLLRCHGKFQRILNYDLLCGYCMVLISSFILSLPNPSFNSDSAKARSRLTLR